MFDSSIVLDVGYTGNRYLACVGDNRRMAQTFEASQQLMLSGVPR